MSTAGKNKLKLAYEGSVKRVWQSPRQDDSLLFEFTDDYSIFDWGKMPETIENKGKALAVFGAYFFELLSKPEFWIDLEKQDAPAHFNRDFLKQLFRGAVMCELQGHSQNWATHGVAPTNNPSKANDSANTDGANSIRSNSVGATPCVAHAGGLASHFQGLVNEAGEKLSLAKAAASSDALFMQVKKAEVQRPTPIVALNQNIFHYPAADLSLKTRLIPLEVVFRFGMPAGSSLKERLQKDPDYAAVLGLNSVPKENEFFDRPVLEFYTKLEPKDRLLSVQEALLISGLSPDQFNDLIERAQLTSLALFWHFHQRGIELWDGKFEFIMHDSQILLADSIGPDELRLIYKGTHLSKELIRQVYRGSSWERFLKEAQRLAKERCVLDWKNICINELKSSPEPFKPAVKNVVDRLYGSLSNHVSEEKLFKDQSGLDEFVEAARQIRLDERRGGE